MDFTSLTSAVSAITAAKNLGTTLVELRDFKNVASITTDLNNKLLQAQDSLFALQTKLFELHTEKEEVLKKLAKLEKAAAQRDCYRLFELSKRAFVYRLKPVEEWPEGALMERHEPIHDICQLCMDIHGVRSVLVRGYNSARLITWDCLNCKNSFPTDESLPPLNLNFRSER